jgi:DNA-binding transcriptional LysR family regulator
MAADLGDLSAFMVVARAGGFRDGARVSGGSASSLSEAVRRLEARLGVRLLNRTTRSVAPTEAGARLLERLGPALGEVEAALDLVNGFRDRPAGTLRLNVPVSVQRQFRWPPPPTSLTGSARRHDGRFRLGEEQGALRSTLGSRWPQADCLLLVATYGEADTHYQIWVGSCDPLPPFTERLPNGAT